MEKWYNRPITWKKYGIFCLVCYAIAAVSFVVYWVSMFGFRKTKKTTE